MPRDIYAPWFCLHGRRARRPYARSGTGFRRIGTAGKDDGDTGAEDDAGGQRVGQIFQLLGDHVAGLEIGDDEYFSMAGDGRLDALGLAATMETALSKAGERAVENAAGDLAAVCHLA